MNVWPTAPVAPSTPTRILRAGSRGRFHEASNVRASHLPIHGRVQIGDLDILVRRVRDRDGAWSEEQRRSPSAQEREYATVSIQRRNRGACESAVQGCAERTRSPRVRRTALEELAHDARIADEPDHELGDGFIRDNVRLPSRVERANVDRGRAGIGVGREVEFLSVARSVSIGLIAGGAKLGVRRMRGAPARVRTVTTIDPFAPDASCPSVGSPLIRKRLVGADSLAARAPSELFSSPTTKRRSTPFSPCSASASAATIIEAAIPFASHAPRPERRAASRVGAMNGGTVCPNALKG